MYRFNVTVNTPTTRSMVGIATAFLTLEPHWPALQAFFHTHHHWDLKRGTILTVFKEHVSSSQ